MTVPHPAGLVTRGLVQPAELGFGWRQYDNLGSLAGASRNVLKVPGDRYVLMQSIYLVYVTSAVVNNRNMLLQLLDPDGNVAREAFSTGNQAASTTNQYTFGWEASGGLLTVGTHTFMPLWQDFLEPGWQLNFAPILADAGDTYSAVRMIYDVYIRGEKGYQTGWREPHDDIEQTQLARRG